MQSFYPQPVALLARPVPSAQIRKQASTPLRGSFWNPVRGARSVFVIAGCRRPRSAESSDAPLPPLTVEQCSTSYRQLRPATNASWDTGNTVGGVIARQTIPSAGCATSSTCPKRPVTGQASSPPKGSDRPLAITILRSPGRAVVCEFTRAPEVVPVTAVAHPGQGGRVPTHAAAGGRVDSGQSQAPIDKLHRGATTRSVRTEYGMIVVRSIGR